MTPRQVREWTLHEELGRGGHGLAILPPSGRQEECCYDVVVGERTGLGTVRLESLTYSLTCSLTYNDAGKKTSYRPSSSVTTSPITWNKRS
jgi:hypothetical protein